MDEYYTISELIEEFEEVTFSEKEISELDDFVIKYAE